MLPVQNHDNIPFEQVNRSKPGYLAYMDNAANTVNASSDTGSVTRRRKSPLGGSEIF